MEQVDLLVVGGGINGAGIARDAAGRGLSVMLVEKDDLAAHTSSASSKLIHGGLRYLEQFDFKLVRESLVERERLLRAAPHIVEPLEFIIPMTPSGRAAWKVRAGLFLYDHLGRRKVLPGSRSLRLGELGVGLRPELDQGFAYWDCRVQDSRLVVLNAMDASERGATILTRTELLTARREGPHWIARIHSSGHERSVEARALVNAAGPWASELFSRIQGTKHSHSVRLVKGSHIVVPRLYEGAHAFLLQSPDGRVVFAIPFEEEFTLVGTTDVDWSEALDTPTISDAEIDYLLGMVGAHFTRKMTAKDVIWSFAGIRSLFDDGVSDPSKATRDYRLELDTSGAPMLSVFGGKITTYRRLAERALDRLAPFLPEAGKVWTERALLPGGDVPDGDVGKLVRELVEAFPALPPRLLGRLAKTYGTAAHEILGGTASIGDLGAHFGADLYACEVDYLVRHEWARSAEDILWRRTKLGLRIAPETANRLAASLATRSTDS
jgi:glycerol-3-phosphate dehydrogenase